MTNETDASVLSCRTLILIANFQTAINADTMLKLIANNTVNLF